MAFNVARFIVVCGFVIILVVLISRQVRRHNSDDTDPMIKILKDIVSNIIPGAAKDIVFHEGEKSYTINKKYVYICLKDDNGKYYDTNTLVYVTLHEISHVFCNSIDHTDEFSFIFDTLLNKASSIGIYDPHKEIPKHYCGSD
jgi:hypothetical protein